MRDSAADRGMGMKRQVIGFRQAALGTAMGTNALAAYLGHESVKAPGKVVEIRIGANVIPATTTMLHIFPYKIDQTLAAPQGGALVGTHQKAKIPLFDTYASMRLPDTDTTPAGAAMKVKKIAVSDFAAVQGLANAGGASTIDLTGVAAAYRIINAANGAHPGGGNSHVSLAAAYAGVDDAVNGMLYVQRADSGATLRNWASLIADYADAGNDATLDRLALSAIGAVNASVFSAPLNKPMGYLVGGEIEILAGTGAGQKKKVIAIDAETMIATVDSAWAPNPASASGWRIIPKNNRVNAGDTILFDVEAAGTTAGAGYFGEVVIEFDDRLNEIQSHFPAI